VGDTGVRRRSRAAAREKVASLSMTEFNDGTRQQPWNNATHGEPGVKVSATEIWVGGEREEDDARAVEK
jgi:hypothetical protein